MNLTDLTTRVFGDKKRWWAYRARKKALPESYLVAIDGVERYLNLLGGITKGDIIMTMLEDLLDLFEQSAASGTTIRGIVGDDPVEFVETFLSNYEEGRWISKERTRLAEAIERAEGLERRTGAEGVEGPS
jgi:DNA-binding ferritin-like protein (Dps family)